MNRLRGSIDPQRRLVSRSLAPTASLALSLAAGAIASAIVAANSPPARQQTLEQQVADTERAFAQTMSDRDLAAFGHFISKEAVFVSGAKTLRGRQQVMDGWRRLYEGANAPFSWEPETVEVLGSGLLALSKGPVHDAAGKLVGTFTSVWRLEGKDTWRIVFDTGCDVCARCAAQTQ